MFQLIFVWCLKKLVLFTIVWFLMKLFYYILKLIYASPNCTDHHLQVLEGTMTSYIISRLRKIIFNFSLGKLWDFKWNKFILQHLCKRISLWIVWLQLIVKKLNENFRLCKVSREHKMAVSTCFRNIENLYEFLQRPGTKSYGNSSQDR